MRPRPGSDPVVFATKTALRTLGRRVLALDSRDRHALDRLLVPLVRDVAPKTAGPVTGSAVDTAAAFLVTAGDNPDRLRSEAAWAHLCGVAPIEASSGKTTRLRLNRGGDRQANAALWGVVITRLSSDPRTRPTSTAAPPKASSKAEIIRVLKRYVAREVYPSSSLKPPAVADLTR